MSASDQPHENPRAVMKRYKDSLRADERTILADYISAAQTADTADADTSYHAWVKTLISIILDYEQRRQQT